MLDGSHQRAQGTRVRVYRRHPTFWLAGVVLPALGLGLLLVLADIAGASLGLVGVLCGLLAVTIAWILWGMRRRIVVSDAGVEEITARGRRTFTWDEIHRVDRRREDGPAVGHHRRTFYAVHGAGGRRLAFHSASVWNAEGLARLIEARRRGPPAQPDAPAAGGG